MSKLRAAVVGVGYLGNFHAQKYQNSADAQLVGVCDHFPQQADKVAAALNVKSFHSPQDLIGQVDLVTIAASTLSHYDLAKLFIQNGIHVNVEKPMTATVPQAQELLKLAEKHRVTLAVGHIERFNPSVIELKKHLKKPLFIELTRMATYKARGADVSVLHDLMIHDIDLLFHLTGSEIESMTAFGSKLVSPELDTASVSVQMKNGVMALIQVSRVATQMQRSIRVVEQDCHYFVDTGSHLFEKVTKGLGGEELVRSESWSVEKADALQSETNAFIEAVRSKKAPVVTGTDGLNALQAIENIQQLIRG